MSYCIVNCTTANKKNAVEIAKSLIEQKLAACVNIIPNVVSIYTWENNICEGEEFLMVIKTQKKLFKKVEAAILAKHEYELPEIILTPIDKGNAKYLKWVKAETKGC